MPRRDPLAVLARLRGLERDRARRALADAAATRDAALAAAEAVQQALAAEACGTVADYAAWLPAARQARARAEDGLRRAEAGMAVARDALAEARAAAEAVETLLSARRAADRRARLAAEQALLDDLPRR